MKVGEIKYGKQGEINIQLVAESTAEEVILFCIATNSATVSSVFSSDTGYDAVTVKAKVS